jgi:ABC-type branched-subunit amino acid transport system ATPase component/ABC-type branched-subunit amino acid transport system permease subunit
MNAGSVVLGVLNGMQFGLLAVGIVLVYRSNRFLNLAYAQLGALPALLLAKFVLQWGWSWWGAFPVCVAAGVATGLLVERALVSRLQARTRSSISLLLLTLGIGEVLLALSYVPALGPGANRLATRGYPLPFHTHITVGSVVLGGQDVLVVFFAPLLVGGLALLLHYSFIGKQLRAAASNPDAARLAGVSLRRVRALAWGLAGGLAAITAVLQAPSQGSFNAAVLGPGLLLFALGAAAFGAFVSITWAIAGGLTLGIVQQLTLAETHDAGAALLVVVAVILAVIVVRGHDIGQAFATSGSVVDHRAPPPPPDSLSGHWLVKRRRAVLGGMALLVAALLPVLPALRAESRRFDLSLVVVYALVAASLAILVGWAGQISLGHFAVVGIGAFVAARLFSHGVSLAAVIVVAGAAGALAMVLVGIPALRVPGLSLAVSSLGLAVVAPAWLYRQSWLGSRQPFGLQAPAQPLAAGLWRPATEAGVYYLGLAMLAVVLLGASAVRASGAGRAILAVRDNEMGAASFGLTPATVKLVALALSGFIAAVGGVVWAEAWRSVAATQFTPDLSMAVLAAPVVGGVTSLSGSVAGAVAIFGVAIFAAPMLRSVFGRFGEQVGFQLALGGAGIILVLLRYPDGLAGAGQRWWQAFLRQVARGHERRTLTDEPDLPLVVSNTSVAFGGIQALNDVSIRVGRGEIVGLIGPNGAGKSTLMNVISGTVRSDRASIRVFGKELAGLAPEFRPAFGVARSFQDATLFPGLTVTEAVQVALDRRHRTGLLSAAVGAPWSRAAESASRTEARRVIDGLGLAAWAASPVAELSTGTRRICDLAAQAAARPSVLLLDEPTAGVAQRDAEAFAPLLRRLRDELGCAVLIIEHDMPLLMGLCDRIYAMDLGRIIAEGTPSEVAANPAVVAAYLGTEPAAARSGPAGAGRRPSARAAVRAGRGEGPRQKGTP